jgi:hypothetical protein
LGFSFFAFSKPAIPLVSNCERLSSEAIGLAPIAENFWFPSA